MKLMRYLTVTTIFAYAIIVGGPANGAVDFAECKVAFVKSQAPKYTNHAKQIISLCKGDKIKFAVSFNKKRRTADFVAYRLTPKMATSTPAIKRKNNWFSPDSKIFNSEKKSFQATRASYRHSGFDRGHLIKAEDMKLDAKAYKSTFLFSSIVPQFPKFNRLGWRKAEQLPRTKIKNGVFDEVWIIAGVTGTHSHSKSMGKSIGIGITVPSCFYRVLIGKKRGNYSVIALLMPNDNKIDNSIIVSDYIVGMDYLEKIIDIDLLPDYNSFDYDAGNWGLEETKELNNSAPACD
ncbi:MAG: DNA/RNA non-specific endonuclease [Rhodospirillaceae bacterium]|nr:DNA/RNA non-specific endonuclease [Rhodospirillaceae bacterium]